jgi:alpha-galactosidase
LTETASGLDITLIYALDIHAILTTDAVLSRGSSAGTTPHDLGGALTLLPLPRRAAEILDFTGKSSRERSPQRRPLHHGAHARDVRRGKPGVDSPYLVPVGVPGFGLRTGEVWAVHVTWSGGRRYLVEQLPEGAGVLASALGGGELLRPGGQGSPVPAWECDGDGLAGAAAEVLLRQRRFLGGFDGEPVRGVVGDQPMT